eukprot:2815006-Pyramimonas_sp.AAC.1
MRDKAEQREVGQARSNKTVDQDQEPIRVPLFHDAFDGQGASLRQGFKLRALGHQRGECLPPRLRHRRRPSKQLAEPLGNPPTSSPG